MKLLKFFPFLFLLISVLDAQTHTGIYTSRVQFKDTTIYNKVSYENAQFVGGFFCIYTKFMNQVNLNRFTHFSRGALFENDTFNMACDFSSTSFNPARFIDCFFNESVSFSGAYLESVSFSETTFRKEVDFTYAGVKGGLWFVDVHFGRYVKFRGIRFEDEGSIFFDRRTRLPDTLDFSEVKLGKLEIDLSITNFDSLNKKADKIHNIYLYKS